MSAAKAAKKAGQSKTGTMLVVRQLKSGIGYSVRQKATLEAMGLGRVGRCRELPDNPQVRGMVAAIPHLVAIVEPEDPSSAKHRGDKR